MEPRGRRLVLFVGGCLGLALGAEGLARLERPALQAAAHRARFKAALLERQGRLDFAVIGTSRLNDGVSPTLMAQALAAEGLTAKGFNASVPSSSLGTQRFLADAAVAHRVETLFLEASPRQLASVEDEALTAPSSPQTFDDRVLAASALVESRRALMAENLPRLGALAFPGRFDGSEFFRTKWLAQWWSDVEGRPPPIAAPALLCPGGPGADETRAGALSSWAETARGREVLFVVPPLAQGRLAEECPAWRGTWQALATRTGRPVWDFSCAGAPEASFNDGFEHLGWEGRRAFSEALARAWVQWRRAPGCGGAR